MRSFFLLACFLGAFYAAENRAIACGGGAARGRLFNGRLFNGRLFNGHFFHRDVHKSKSSYEYKAAPQSAPQAQPRQQAPVKKTSYSVPTGHCPNCI